MEETLLSRNTSFGLGNIKPKGFRMTVFDELVDSGMKTCLYNLGLRKTFWLFGEIECDFVPIKNLCEYISPSFRYLLLLIVRYEK